MIPLSTAMLILQLAEIVLTVDIVLLLPSLLILTSMLFRVLKPGFLPALGVLLQQTVK